MTIEITTKTPEHPLETEVIGICTYERVPIGPVGEAEMTRSDCFKNYGSGEYRVLSWWPKPQ